MRLKASSILGHVPCGLEEGRKRRLPYLWMLLVALTELRFVLDEDSYLVPELDGVRIFSRSTHEFLHEVPGEAPKSILWDSRQVLLIPCQPPKTGSGWVLRAELRIFIRHFYSKIPLLVASEEIFKIASMAPGALLLEAQKEYEVNSGQLLRFPRCSLPFSSLD